MRAAAGTVLHYHREYADPVHRVQLPGYAYGYREAGAVLHPGDFDPAGGIWGPGAAVGTAGGGSADFCADAGDCGDGGAGVEGDGKGGARLAPPLKPLPLTMVLSSIRILKLSRCILYGHSGLMV